MSNSYEFLNAVLDTVAENIVVINQYGDIVFVNKAWCSFGESNECQINNGSWHEVNYLQECDKAALRGDEYGLTAAEGIRSVIQSDKEKFYFEYPCHSPIENRWFLMRAIPFVVQGYAYIVISHLNITERKTAEEKVWKLSREDSLTQLANRRYFDEFLNSELSRCCRLGAPLTLALIDLDKFKVINDTHGHQAGDDCLKAVGGILKGMMQRPGDLSARYGGEEFAVVFGNTELDQALPLLDKLLNEIRTLKLPVQQATAESTLTVSIGVVTMRPDKNSTASELIERADQLMYTAKLRGRNQIATDMDIEKEPVLVH